MPGSNWTKKDIDLLIEYCDSKKYYFKEIADLLNKKPGTVRYKARKLNLTAKPVDPTWSKKHDHKAILAYFVNHSFEETAKHFNLADFEIKSALTVAYRIPSLAHLRKDVRPKDRWTLEDDLNLISLASFNSRSEIAKQIGRLNSRVVKERMRKLNFSGKFLNGMPVTWARLIWPKKVILTVDTSAGPTYFKFKIISWSEALELCNKYETDPLVVKMILALSKFQKWILDGKKYHCIK